MIQESRGNVFCIKHGGPLSECTDECIVKQGVKLRAEVDSKNVWAKDSRLPMTDEQAVARAQALQQADLVRIARVRAEQEALLKKSKEKSPVGGPEEPKTE